MYNQALLNSAMAATSLRTDLAERGLMRDINQTFMADYGTCLRLLGVVRAISRMTAPRATAMTAELTTQQPPPYKG